MIRLREWAAQINECNNSGLTVKQWCDGHGINRKTYYNRVRIVREEMLNRIETEDAHPSPDEISQKTYIENAIKHPRRAAYVNAASDRQTEVPVFAELQAPSLRVEALTVRLGRYDISIYNNADTVLVEHVLRLTAQL